MNKELDELWAKLHETGGAQRLAYLRQRWEDEKEYEDWSDYATALKQLLPVGARAEVVAQRPFGVRFDYGGKRYQLTATLRSLHLREVPITRRAAA